MFRRLAIAGVALLAACGGDSAAPTTTTTAPATTTAATTTAPTTTTTTVPEPEGPSVEFDGGACVYSGPIDFEGGGLVAFQVRNTGDTDFGFILLRVDEELDYESVAGLMGGFRGIGPDLPEGITERSGSGILGPGDEENPSIPLTADGNYLPACQTWPDNDWRIADAFITVTGA